MGSEMCIRDRALLLFGLFVVLLVCKVPVSFCLGIALSLIHI